MKNLSVIVGFGLALLLSACERPIKIGCISPEGSVEERVVEFDNFDRIEIIGDAEVFITEGATQEVVIEAAPNIIDRLIDDSRVNNDDELVLEINGCAKIDNGELIVRITMAELTGLTITGDGSYTTEGLFENVEDIFLDIRGDGEMDLQFNEVERVSVGIIGDGDIVCSGVANLVSINISGDGDIDFFDFAANDLELSIIGDANCKLNIVEAVDIEITGDGDVESIGTATLQEIEVTGDAKIKNFEISTEITNINLRGDGDLEVRISEELNVGIIGDGKVCYKGDGEINIDTPTTGEVRNCN